MIQLFNVFIFEKNIILLKKHFGFYLNVYSQIFLSIQYKITEQLLVTILNVDQCQSYFFAKFIFSLTYVNHQRIYFNFLLFH